MIEILTEDIEVPLKDSNIQLKGTIYSTIKTPKKAPWIINLPGITEHRESKFVKTFTEKFALTNNYYVLVYDYRGHGETASQTGKNYVKIMKDLFSDISEVIKWINITQKERLFNNQIILFGRSLGGAIILTRGFMEEGAKILIPLCARYDYATYTGLQFSEDIIKYISPKYYIKNYPLNNERILTAHCKDDKQIPFDNLNHICSDLGLIDTNVMIFETGGHCFKNHREEIFQKSHAFIQERIIESSDVDIPMDTDDVFLKGSVYFSKKTPKKAPWIIVTTGLLGDRTSYFPNFFIEKFAKAGYYVLCYDHRAHGETAKQTGKNWIKLLPEIFNDIHRVVDWILKTQREKLLDEDIYLFGRSFSGAMSLTQGYQDDRIKKIIALCTRHDYRKIKAKFPEDCIDFMSCKNYLRDSPNNNNRIMIAHCKDDERILFFNLEKIQQQLKLRDENVVIFEDGGHSFKGHREELSQQALQFLKKL